jgi:hypothetical protein
MPNRAIRLSLTAAAVIALIAPRSTRSEGARPAPAAGPAVEAPTGDDVLALRQQTAGWVTPPRRAGDACRAIAAAIEALPPSGGVVDARGYVGVQPCSVNPVAQADGIHFPRSFVLLLGAATFEVDVPWSFGRGTFHAGFGQFVVGSGVGVTILQPTKRFSGAAVLQIRPSRGDVIVGNASFSGLTIDMANVTNQTAVEFLSASNLPAIHDLVVQNQDGRFVHVAAQDAHSTIPEGITFHDWYFYARPPKVAPGIVIENANEVVFRDGKLLGRDPSKDSQVGVLLQSGLAPGRPINTAGEGITFTGASIASYQTGIRLTAAGDWDPARNCSFIGMTMEENDVAFDFAGRDPAHRTFGNYVAGTRYLPSVKVHVRLDHAHGNLVEEASITSAGPIAAYVLTANSANNLILRRFTQVKKTDVSDAGVDNVVLGWLAGQGLQVGRGGEDATNAAVNIDAGASGVPSVAWRRQGTSVAMASVSDAFGPGELVATVGTKNFRFTPGGTAIVPVLRLESGVAADGGGLKHARVATGAVAPHAEQPVVVHWRGTFADANYTVSAVVASPGESADGLRVTRVVSVAPGSAVVMVRNDSDRSQSGLLHCIAVHD